MSIVVYRTRFAVRSIAAGAMILSVDACASAPKAAAGMIPAGSQPGITAPPPAMPLQNQAPLISAPLPPLSGGQARVVDALESTIEHLNVPAGAELGNTVRMLASQFGMGVSIEAGAKAPVNASLSGLTLRQALDRLVTQQGYSYVIQDSVIRITAARLETRFFSFGYVNVSRSAFASTSIPRRLSGGGASAVAGGGQTQPASTVAAGGGSTGGGGGDAITAQTDANLWAEIRAGLDALVFQNDPSVRRGTDSTTQGSNPQTPNSGGGTVQSQVHTHVEPDGRMLVINPIAGHIMVTASPARLKEVEAYLTSIESSVIRQVMIEARFVEVGFKKNTRFGIDWSVVLNRGNTEISARTPGAGGNGIVEFTLTGGAAQITAVLDALESQGTVQEVGRPTVTATNNQPAVMNVVTDEVFFTTTRQPNLGPTGATIGFTTQVSSQTIPVGIVLNVVPQISADNVTHMLIRPMLTTVSRVETFQLEDGTRTSQPVVDRKEADTMARLRDGETIIIGGLTKNRTTRERTGVPFFSKIPGLGRLFTHYEDVDQRSELVIFLTPHVMAGSPSPQK